MLITGNLSLNTPNVFPAFYIIQDELSNSGKWEMGKINTTYIKLGLESTI
jgi:hypothetical protein